MGTRAWAGEGLGNRVLSWCWERPHQGLAGMCVNESQVVPEGQGPLLVRWGRWGSPGLGGVRPYGTLPEVLDADHLAPGPGPVHGPTIWICALREAVPIRPGHSALLPTLRDPWVLAIH